MRALVEEAGLGDRVTVDSAGTSAWHIGEKPDPRSRQCARERGVELRSRGRQFVAKDFGHFEYVLAMDGDNREELLTLAPDDRARGSVYLLRSFDADSPANADVPDPYYGGERGFDDVFDICEAACRGLLERVLEQLAREPR